MLLVEATARVGHLQHHGMFLGELVPGVLQHEAEVERIARAPYAALSIEEALQALVDGFARHVQVAHRECGSVIELEVAALRTLAGNEQEGLVLGAGEGRKSFAVGQR
ncbi:MAG: hypothetical protein IPG92_07825 [Flavobacteriales bacterium]|nr:hypothetical protein [Flavobacteriales bacterium]